MVSGLQAAGVGARAMDKATAFQVLARRDHQPHRPRQISFSCVTGRVSGPFGMNISLALREAALWGVTDGGSWHC